jgi:hypothetical protein
MRHIAQVVVHGNAGSKLNRSESRTMVGEFKKHRAHVSYTSVPGGHHGNVVVPNMPRVFESLDAYKRVMPAASPKLDHPDPIVAKGGNRTNQVPVRREAQFHVSPDTPLVTMFVQYDVPHAP